MSTTPLKLNELPKDGFELRGKLFSFGIDDRISQSIGYIQNEFNLKDKLYLCCEFMDYVYLDTFKGDIRELNKHGGFPAIETSYQFDFSIKHAISGSYKAAFDNLRSCLELTTLSIYFSFDKDILVEEDILSMSSNEILDALQNEKKWLNSLSNTPFFSQMIKRIEKEERVASFNSSHNWIEKLKQNYYTLSDYTHIKGYKMGIQEMSSIKTNFSRSCFHNVNMYSLNLFLTLLIETVENIVLLISLYNPMVLLELPLEEKFGINEPVGFIHISQAEIVNQLIPKIYEPYFDKLKTDDEELLGLAEWVNSLPSLNEKDLEHQIKGFSSLFEGKE